MKAINDAIIILIEEISKSESSINVKIDNLNKGTREIYNEIEQYSKYVHQLVEKRFDAIRKQVEKIDQKNSLSLLTKLKKIKQCKEEIEEIKKEVGSNIQEFGCIKQILN